MTDDSYKARMERARAQNYLKVVVSQPTKQSNIKAKLDKNSPTGISRDKGK